MFTFDANNNLNVTAAGSGGGTVTVSSPSVVSAGNSSTTPLGSNAVFTGTAVDLLPYKALSIAVFADQAGSLSVQYSEDQTNWDLTETVAVVASTALTNQFTIRARFFRLVYTNGSVAQGAFRLQTLLHPAPLGVRLAPVSQQILAADEALTTHTQITGLNSGGGGSYVDVKVNPSGSLQVQDNADTGLGGTTAPAQVMVAGGKTNDSTPQFQPMPEGAGGRSVIVEGFTGGTAVPVSQPTASNLNAIVQQGVPTVGGLSQSWPIKISDGVNGPAAVKAASTAAVAADPALVVSVSPNSPATVVQPTAANLNATTLGAVSSLSQVTWNTSTPTNSQFNIPCSGYGTVFLYIQANASVTGGQLRFLETTILTDIQGMRVKNSQSAPVQFYDATNIHNLANGGETITYVFNCAGLTGITVLLLGAITGAGGSIALSARATLGTPAAPTTVGQSDITKLNATTAGAFGSVQTASITSATGQGNQIVVPCTGYNTVVLQLSTNSGTFSGGRLNFYIHSAGNGVYTAVTGMRQLNLTDQAYDASFGFSPSTPSQDWLYYFDVGYADTFIVYVQSQITGSGTVTISARPVNTVVPGPTTVGQSDPTKHRVSVFGNAGSFKTYSNVPAAGSQALLTVPAGFKWFIKGGSIQLTASASAGNRNLLIQAQDASSNFLVQVAALASGTTNLNQTAGQSVQYSFFPAATWYMTAPVNNNIAIPFPELCLGPGAKILTNIQGLLAGDTVSLIVNVNELPD